jgi:hypothetical protein
MNSFDKWKLALGIIATLSGIAMQWFAVRKNGNTTQDIVSKDGMLTRGLILMVLGVIITIR